LNIQGLTAAGAAEDLERVEDGLQEQVFLAGKDRRDDIDDLRYISHGDGVGMADEEIHLHGIDQGVFQIVVLFQMGFRGNPSEGGVSAVPDIPSSTAILGVLGSLFSTAMRLMIPSHC